MVAQRGSAQREPLSRPSTLAGQGASKRKTPTGLALSTGVTRRGPKLFGGGADLGASVGSSSSSKRSNRGSSKPQPSPVALKTDQVELYNSKIYDEELVDQQLGDRIKALQEQLGKVRSSDGSGAVELKLLAMVQSRSHQVAARANETAANNQLLKDEVQRMRNENSLRRRAAENMRERIAFLGKEVPKLIEATSHDLHEVDRQAARKATATQEAKALLSHQERELSRLANDLAEADERISSIELAHHFAEESRRQQEYRAGKELRTGAESQAHQLEYLSWQAGWWEGEFGRLGEVTSQALGAEAEPGAVQRVTERILEMRQQNDSLMTYLQQLDSEASELAASNAVLAASHATLRERSVHLAEPPPREDADAGTQRAGGGDIDDYGQRAEALELWLASAAAPAASILRHLEPLDAPLAAAGAKGAMAAGSITEQCALLLPALSAAASGEGEGWRKVEAVDEALVQLRKVVARLHSASKLLVLRREEAPPNPVSPGSTTAVVAGDDPEEEEGEGGPRLPTPRASSLLLTDWSEAASRPGTTSGETVFSTFRNLQHEHAKRQQEAQLDQALARNQRRKNGSLFRALRGASGGGRR
uniref:Uncharacterized protein n=2 Tax=Emiliania huxleyi TaxID=2903 RepID=A0A7S3WYI0_EMIHU